MFTNFPKLTFYWPHLCSEEERGNLRFVITSSIKRESRIFVNGKEPACERLAQCFSLCFDWPSKIGGNVSFFSVMDGVLMQSQRNFTILCHTRPKMIYFFSHFSWTFLSASASTIALWHSRVFERSLHGESIQLNPAKPIRYSTKEGGKLGRVS